MSKKRDANFTKEETDKLMELIEQYLDIILNSKCSLDVNRQKEDAWNLIAEEFNSYTTNHRTAKQLKHKLENMKKRSELRELQQQLHAARSNGEKGEDEHTKWLKRLEEEKEKCKTFDDIADMSDDNTPPPPKKTKGQTIYVKPLPTLYGSDTTMEEHRIEDDEPQRDNNSLMFSAEQIADLFKLECKQKQERHRQQMEYEKKLQDAHLNKLALEARIYEAQLNKTNLEVKQLTRRLQREEEMHQAQKAREAELHALQVTNCKMNDNSLVIIRQDALDD